MEKAKNIYRFIDLTALNEKGRHQMLRFYKELLQKFPRKNRYSGTKLQREISELAAFNNEKNITVPRKTDISGITDEMYDGIF